jgi:hypothetical protein
MGERAGTSARLDSRLRGNDGCRVIGPTFVTAELRCPAPVLLKARPVSSSTVIPAKEGIHNRYRM